MAEFDVQHYLKLVELDEHVKIGDAPSLTLLKLLVKHQVQRVAFQNLDSVVNRSEVDLTPSALLRRLLADNRGGICYESSELMLKVLQEFKFDARRVACFCLINLQPYTPDAVDNHHIIIVRLDGGMYLVDAGFGYNSIREPLKFSFDTTDEASGLPFEKYRLECNKDHYVLQMWLKETWTPLYRFGRPLMYMNYDLCVAKYREFITSTQPVYIRDSVFKAGIVTATGRRGFSCSFDSKTLKASPPYVKLEVDINGVMHSEQVSYAEFRDEVQKLVDVPMNDDHFEK